MSVPGRFVHGDEMGLMQEQRSTRRGETVRVAFEEDELGRVHVLNGTFAERKRAWDALAGCLGSFDRSVYIIGLGAQGTVLLYCLGKWLMPWKRVKSIRVIDARSERRVAFDYVLGLMGDELWAKAEFIGERVREDNWQSLLPVERGDLVVDLSVGTDTLTVAGMCVERGAYFVNSAIEDWLIDGWTPPENVLEESMYYAHRELMRGIPSGQGRACVSMGCNPGNVSLWLRTGLEWMAGRLCPGRMFASYSDMCQAMGVETIHVSELDNQIEGETCHADEYANTWSTDSAAFYKEGMGPSESSLGVHETIMRDESLFCPGGLMDHFAVWNYSGFEMTALTVVPYESLQVVRGYIVRHDESYTIGRAMTSEDGSYAPSVYYVYHPSEATCKAVERLRVTGDRVFSYHLMAKGIVGGRDQVGAAVFCSSGQGIWCGSVLDIEEARAMMDGEMDDYVNATINQTVGGYLCGIWQLLKIDREGVRDGLGERVIDAESVDTRLECPLWGPVIVMPFKSPFASNRIQDMGLELGMTKR